MSWALLTLAAVLWIPSPLLSPRCLPQTAQKRPQLTVLGAGRGHILPSPNTVTKTLTQSDSTHPAKAPCPIFIFWAEFLPYSRDPQTEIPVCYLRASRAHQWFHWPSPSTLKKDNGTRVFLSTKQWALGLFEPWGHKKHSAHSKSAFRVG